MRAVRPRSAAPRSPTRAPTSSSSTGRATCRRSRPSSARAPSTSYDLAELARYIDWTPFFHAWELKGDLSPHPRRRQIWRGRARPLRRRASHAEAAHRGEMADRQRRGRLLACQQRRRRYRALYRRHAHEASRHASHHPPADGPGQGQAQSRARRFRRAEGDGPRRLCRRLRRDRRHRRGGRGAAVRARQRRLFQDHGQGACRPPGRGLCRGAA